jgi:hypothetical protein
MPTIIVLYEITEHEVVIQMAAFSNAKSTAGQA